MKKCALFLILSVFISTLVVPLAFAGSLKLVAPDYVNWYGCSPTAAGMMMGYYDRNGYGGLFYNNLVPGGVAELETFIGPPTGSGALANKAIASQGHVNDFYQGVYGASGDDVSPPFHSFNCLADFMGSSQDSAGNTNGSTTWYFWTNGDRLYAKDAVAYYDGMLGMDKYFRYAGYGTGDITTDINFYTQRINSTSAPSGCTFADYKALIDAHQVVMIHVDGWDLLGYGYDDTGQIIYVHDGLSLGDHTMTWGGLYNDMQMWGITCFTPTGGSTVPLPPTVWLLGSGLLGLAGLRRFMNS